jgi:MerR family copper efflux transcriptional regulator
MYVVKVVEHCGHAIVTANVDGDYDKMGLPEPLVVTWYFSISDNKNRPAHHSPQLISSGDQCAVVWRELDMNIGEVAKASGVSAKMIRHYERAGLIQAAMPTESNYRVYTRKDVEVLRFVKQARRLGFSMKHISILLDLWENRSRPSSDVKRLAKEPVEELDLRIGDLTDMRDTLEQMAQHCRDARI